MTAHTAVWQRAQARHHGRDRGGIGCSEACTSPGRTEFSVNPGGSGRGRISPGLFNKRRAFRLFRILIRSDSDLDTRMVLAAAIACVADSIWLSVFCLNLNNLVITPAMLLS